MDKLAKRNKQIAVNSDIVDTWINGNVSDVLKYMDGLSKVNLLRFIEDSFDLLGIDGTRDIISIYIREKSK